MNDVRDHDHVDDHHDGGCHHFHNVIARSELIHEAQPYCDVTMERSQRLDVHALIVSCCDAGDAHRIPNKGSDMRVINHQQPMIMACEHLLTIYFLCCLRVVHVVNAS